MQKVQLIDKTFSAQLSEKKRKSSLRWAAVNAGFLSVLLFDILTTKKYYSQIQQLYYVECIAATILSLSFLTNLIQFIYHSWFVDKIVCDNEDQRLLLNLSNNSIVKTPTSKIPMPVANQNETINIRNLSYQTYSERESCSNPKHHRVHLFCSFLF